MSFFFKFFIVVDDALAVCKGGSLLDGVGNVKVGSHYVALVGLELYILFLNLLNWVYKHVSPHLAEFNLLKLRMRGEEMA